MKTFLQYYKIDENEVRCHFMYRRCLLEQRATLFMNRFKRWIECTLRDDGVVVTEVIDDCEISERTGWYLKVNKAHDKVIGKWTHVKDTFFFLLEDGNRIYR